MDNGSSKNIRLTFAGLADGEAAPQVALYAVDDHGKPSKQLARAKDGVLPIAPDRLKGRVAIGPDVEDMAGLSPDRLVQFRAEQVAASWATEGLILPRSRWTIFWPPFHCVSGRVRKCRPWWWDVVALSPVVATRGAKLSQAAAFQVQAQNQISVTSAASASYIFPWRCLPLCDGIVEVYERQCCCVRVHLPDLLDRLRDILERVPIPWPPEPDPGPWPGPIEGPLGRGPGRLAAAQRPRLGLKAPTGTIAAAADPSFAPPERLYEAYLDLQRLPPAEAERYALERVWLHPFFCHCTSRKVGEVAIQPGGEFNFCYLRGPVPFRCWLTHAYRVRQRINGVWVTVYDGVASGAWFADGEDSELRVTDHRALPCGDPPGDAPPGDGAPFVMLEHVTGAGTHHFNFPDQTGVSQVGALGVDDGLYDTGYAPDCPWADTLRLRLWVSPELNGTVAFYRLSVMPVSATGSPSGAPKVLDGPVSWSRFVLVGGEWVVQAEGLGPVTQGAESGLFRVPYWTGGMNWLSGQFHQDWNTATFSGRYMLIIELFDAAGARIKPNGAAGPGVGKAFQLRRWSSGTVTENVPFADCAHVFWVDNTAVAGDIVDLRMNGAASGDECQFMKGSGADQFSIGYRAYHPNGVSNTDSFMYAHSITWQRGLNGQQGVLAPAVSATTDAGELPAPQAQSGSDSFANMLGPNSKCTFSVHLAVYAKHFNGGSRLAGFDYHETASFALDQGP